MAYVTGGEEEQGCLDRRFYGACAPAHADWVRRGLFQRKRVVIDLIVLELPEMPYTNLYVRTYVGVLGGQKVRIVIFFSYPTPLP